MTKHLPRSCRWRPILAGSAILAFLLFAVFPAWASVPVVLCRSAGETGLPREENRDDPARNLYWRLTKNGWQYVYLEPPELVPAVIRPAVPPAVHPVVVTMLIALAALAAIAWASDEWDWHRMVGE